MDEKETLEHPYSAPGGKNGRSEEVSDALEEPDQRRPDRDRPCLPRNEQIRLIVLGLALLALLVGFLLDFITGAILPLFATMVVVYLGYRRLDTWLDTHEPPYF
jgi:hypothetical protein